MGTSTKRNAPCWCGSGRKYKKCHLGREAEPRPTVQHTVELMRKVRSAQICLQPFGTDSPCGGKIVSAHTVSKSAGLKRIAEGNRVIGTRPGPKANRESQLFWPISIRQASTFTGFCGKHDKALFSEIEDRPLVPTKSQVVALGFRSCALELYAKRGVVALADDLRRLDAGLPLESQRQAQGRMQYSLLGNESGLHGIEALYSRYAAAVGQGDPSSISFIMFEFDSEPIVMNSSQWHAEFGFDGRIYQDLSATFVNFESLSIEFLSTQENRQAVLLSWFEGSRSPLQFIDSLLQLPEEQYSSALLRFLLLASENCYFRPSWWETLGEQLRAVFNCYPVNTGFAPPEDEIAFLTDESIRIADWALLGVTRSS